MQQHAQMKQHESALIESRIKQIEAYYKIENVSKTEKKLTSAGFTARAFLCLCHYLLLAADNNSSFYKTLRKGDQERSKAAWSLRILEWAFLYS